MYNCCLFVLNAFKTEESPKTGLLMANSVSELVYSHSLAIQQNPVEALLRMDDNWK